MTEPVLGNGEYVRTNVFRLLTERLVPDIVNLGASSTQLSFAKPYLRCFPYAVFTFTPLSDFPDISMSEWFIPLPRSYLTTGIRRHMWRLSFW